MSKFSDFFATHSPCEPALPLCHTTEWDDFVHIEENGFIAPQECQDANFNGESLIFFFYGRPAYKPETIPYGQATSSISLLPTCFVVDSKKLENVLRIAPFDTGAMSISRYEKVLGRKLKVDDYLLQTSIPMAQRLVNFFYGSNRQYIHHTPINNKSIPPNQPEVRMYYQLISHSGLTVDYDDRAGTIEIQSDQPFILSSDSVLLVLIPDFAAEYPDYIEKLYKVWASDKIILYPNFGIHHPTFYITFFYQFVSMFLNEKMYYQ